MKEVSFSCGLVVSAMLLAPSGALGEGIQDARAVGALLHGPVALHCTLDVIFSLPDVSRKIRLLNRHSRNGTFLEMKATAYGVSNVRLLMGFNF